MRYLELKQTEQNTRNLFVSLCSRNERTTPDTIALPDTKAKRKLYYTFPE